MKITTGHVLAILVLVCLFFAIRDIAREFNREVEREVRYEKSLSTDEKIELNRQRNDYFNAMGAMVF